MSSHPIFVSSGAFASDDMNLALDEAAKGGVKHVELSSGLSYKPDNIALARRRRDQFSFLVHNYFPIPEQAFVLNLAAEDPSALRKSREHCAIALELTAEFEAPFYAAHAGFAASVEISDLGRPFSARRFAPRNEALARFTESVYELVSLARRLGVTFLIENNVVAPFNAREGRNDALLLADPVELSEFARSIDDPHFGYLADVGHLNVSARTLGFDRDAAMAAIVPWVKAFHLSNNDGLSDSNEPFGDQAWFLPWLKKCPAAVSIIEAYRLPPDDLSRCLSSVRAWI